jgi:antitoxin (DNA-binding transcriptional repressor) of toxin-antitoxin stability system
MGNTLIWKRSLFKRRRRSSLRLIKKACQGEEIIIARGRSQSSELVAIRNQYGDRKPGAWKGKIKIEPEFFEPLLPEELEGWECSPRYRPPSNSHHPLLIPAVSVAYVDQRGTFPVVY